MMLIILAIALASAGPAYAADSVGRLFYTPPQRTQLDTARAQKNQAVLAAENQETALPQMINYQGMVKRSDGKSTLWVNGRPVSNPDALSALSLSGRVSSTGSITVQFPQSSRTAELKVGQSAELTSGIVEDAYARAPPALKSDGVREEKAPAPPPAPKPTEPGTADNESGESGTPQDGLKKAIQLRKTLDDALKADRRPVPVQPPPK